MRLQSSVIRVSRRSRAIGPKNLSAQAFPVVLIILSPFLLLPVAGLLGGRGARRAGFLAVCPALLTAWFAYAFWSVLTTGPFTVAVPWVDALGLSLSFHLDGLSLLFAILIAGIGALIVAYAAAYLDGHRDAGRFQMTLFAFMGSMLGVVLTDNLLALFVFWELTGFTSYLLIGFEHEQEASRRAALQALLVTGAGGLGLLAAGVMVFDAGGTAQISDLLASGTSLRGHAMYVPIVCVLLLAAFTKSAQFPFHFWLPNAMQAPTPVSAYLHSATMVKAGVYLVARMTPVLGGSDLWTALVTTAGALTMIGAAYRSILETDLKRVLAYSTIGALGILMLLLGIGTAQAVVASLVYLVAHACYKGALFLVAGAIEHEAGTRDVRALGGLRASMPLTAAAAALAAASMAGVPLLVGFVAKEQFYEAAGQFAAFGVPAGVVLAGGVVASAMLGAAGLLAGVGPFAGARGRAADVHEAPTAMWAGPLILGAAGLLLGVLPALVDAPIAAAAQAVTRADTAVALTGWHGFTPTLLLSLVTLAATAMLFAYRDRVRRVTWPRALRTERVYQGTLDGLDALSRLVAPALQSASLRAYVLTIVASAVALVGTALAAGRALPGLRRWTPVEPHEAAIGLFIVAAAVSAAVARSNMAAVLSLGGVGYGVALVYALFSAPDLAMTQFAVETLTVVIFVLVFRQFSGAGELSSRAVRTRDALIAAAGGTLITTLVLFIAASGTSSRLAEYFVDSAPRLGHGRNVVNVMLVDFRALDTLGEATVLVTVAVGGGALLGIARERRS
jgi:multicomponent Na+:H+ antiporter subunit A